MSRVYSQLWQSNRQLLQSMSSAIDEVRSSTNRLWQHYEDPNTSRTYWYNTETEETFWDDVGEQQRSSANQLWVQYEDPATGKPYWSNDESSEYFYVGIVPEQPRIPEDTQQISMANATEHSMHIDEAQLTYEQARQLKELKKNLGPTKARELIIRPCYQSMTQIIGPREMHIHSMETNLEGLPWRQCLASVSDLHTPDNPITKCSAKLFLSEADPNYEDRPRLDLVAVQADGTWVRWHPKAKLIWSTEPKSEAVLRRENRTQNVQVHFTMADDL